MYAEITDRFHFQYMQATGTISMWSNGNVVQPYKVPGDYGSRQFFKLGGYYIKAEYVYEERTGQCKDEVYTLSKLDLCDKQFFTRVLACDVEAEEGIHWTMFHWVKLNKCRTNGYLYEACYNKVDRLCDKYGISDVLRWVNINWFIVKGKPLIVDCGISNY